MIENILINRLKLVILLEPEEIREKILENLNLQGFSLNEEHLIEKNKDFSKHEIRLLHSHFKKHILDKEQDFIKKNLKSYLKYFASGSDIDINRFKPKLILVEPNSDYSILFRLASLLWSVPVSQGYGRRIRFIVLDEYNEKLIGIFALGDPVFNLKARDNIIDWDYKTRMNNLYYVLDLFVAGSIPPYSELLCGKLITMLSTTSKIQEIIWEKYKDSTSNIQKISRKPHLVLITTSSALGRSSQYNRINFNNKRLFIKVGETSGWGHFHLSNGTYSLMRDYLISIDHKIVKSNRFGNGPNWKIRFIRTALQEIGLSADLLNHGVKRELYFAPLASNYCQFLKGHENTPDYYKYDMHQIIEYFKQRYFIPRSIRKNDYLKITKEMYLKELLKFL